MKTNTSTFTVFFLALGILFLIVGCKDGSGHLESDIISLNSTGETENFKVVATTPSTISDNDQSILGQNQIKIIRNAKIRMKVNNIEDATRVARKYASQYAGYISDERMQNSTYIKENRFTVRVPQNYFDELMDSISSLSNYIDSKDISTINVTEEYVDLQSRLGTKKGVRERYETILRGKAKTVEEVLNAEEKIRVLQEEIEVAEGRLRYLTSNISYSTIQVDVYEIIDDVITEKENGPSFMTEMVDSLSTGLFIIRTFIIVILRIWPLLIIAVVLVLVIFRKRKIKN